MNKNDALLDELMEDVSGGVLPPGWKTTVDNMAPELIKQFANISYEQACEKIDKELVGNYGINAKDGALIKDYIKKYFGENNYILPEYL